ncbi:MAG: flagellar export protein FliJ [Armatimonadota bacterium]|nr:flagellar export protein FliJ [Armatimonadota bacterium]
MKNFKFRMQTVLDQRERRETIAKQSFAEAQAALSRAERLLRELQEVRDALTMELTCLRESSFDPFETRVYQEYLQTIRQSLRDQENLRRELAQTCEAQKLHMIGASQDRQALSKVRDRDQSAHQKEALRIEQGLLDEMAASRHSHRRREGDSLC